MVLQVAIKILQELLGTFFDLWLRVPVHTKQGAIANAKEQGHGQGDCLFHPPGPAGLKDIAELLQYAVQYNSSDLHITVGRPPMVRINGRLIPSGYETVLTPDETKSLMYSILTDEQKAKFEGEHELDFSIGIPDISRR